MKLSIIIVNYKTPDLLLRCIDSVVRSISDDMHYEIIVVDNNSGDNSEKLIHDSFKQVVWIQKHENDGFGRANNVGINYAKGKYILLLNSDMVVTDRSIEQCINLIMSDQSIGVLGCKIINEDGSFQKSTYSIADLRQLLDLNLIINKIFPAGKEKTEAVMGSFMLIPTSVFEKCGLFDPDFFMYAEELELCNRISKNGFRIVYFDKVEVIHRHGGSINDKNWAIKQRYLSNALLFYKVRGPWGYLLYHNIFCLNSLTNFCAIWLLDANYRKEYFMIQRAYFSNSFQYLLIPFLYKRRSGDGKKLLRKS